MSEPEFRVLNATPRTWSRGTPWVSVGSGLWGAKPMDCNSMLAKLGLARLSAEQNVTMDFITFDNLWIFLVVAFVAYLRHGSLHGFGYN